VEEGSGERSEDAVEEFHEDQADRISLDRQTVAAGSGQLFDKAFGAQLGEIVAKGGQAVLLGGATEGAEPSNRSDSAAACGGKLAGN
jgi:hypothetical protein